MPKLTAEVMPSPNWGSVWIYDEARDVIAMFPTVEAFKRFTGRTVEEFNRPDGNALIIAREACARRAEADDATHTASMYRTGRWDEESNLQTCLMGVRAALVLE